MTLSCRDATELATDAMEGLLSGDALVRFDEHVSRCASCREYVRQLGRVVALLRALPREPAPETDADALAALRRRVRPFDPPGGGAP